ncbi:uncharacterized protein EI97DRAFT_484557 [Westerdykella ornata]|uniref:Uncharacterized protein n=1 Tax=Westerdykella ornata TaxID=318751 RepID=A0A6A6JQB1_WESOR|nr:uncharacterized protein EI97DRAFT_484557 [Westerdykella ornata]KAF2278830.1 hypothetical protein EI97DRAFT_484557 [Westerdykella ornata]
MIRHPSLGCIKARGWALCLLTTSLTPHRTPTTATEIAAVAYLLLRRPILMLLPDARLQEKTTTKHRLQAWNSASTLTIMLLQACNRACPLLSPLGTNTPTQLSPGHCLMVMVLLCPRYQYLLVTQPIAVIINPVARVGKGKMRAVTGTWRSTKRQQVIAGILWALQLLGNCKGAKPTRGRAHARLLLKRHPLELERPVGVVWVDRPGAAPSSIIQCPLCEDCETLLLLPAQSKRSDDARLVLIKSSPLFSFSRLSHRHSASHFAAAGSTTDHRPAACSCAMVLLYIRPCPAVHVHPPSSFVLTAEDAALRVVVVTTRCCLLLNPHGAASFSRRNPSMQTNPCKKSESRDDSLARPRPCLAGLSRLRSAFQKKASDGSTISSPWPSPLHPPTTPPPFLPCQSARHMATAAVCHRGGPRALPPNRLFHFSFFCWPLSSFL